MRVCRRPHFWIISWDRRSGNSALSRHSRDRRLIGHGACVNSEGCRLRSKMHPFGSWGCETKCYDDICSECR